MTIAKVQQTFYKFHKLRVRRGRDLMVPLRMIINFLVAKQYLYNDAYTFWMCRNHKIVIQFPKRKRTNKTIYAKSKKITVFV